MLRLLKMHLEACRVGCYIKQWMQERPEDWRVRPVVRFTGQSVVEAGTWRVVLTPCERCPCLRAMDHVRVYVDGSDLYLPLVVRLRVRTATRLLLLDKAWQSRLEESK
jgi:hypothetical protein